MNSGFDRSALVIVVEGDDRDRVEGLSRRLASRLKRGKRSIAWIDKSFMYVAFSILFLPLWTALSYLGVDIVWALRLAKSNNRWEPAEIAAVVAGFLLSVAVCVGYFWLFPTLELLPPNESTRWKRFKVVTWSIIGAILAAALYDVLRAVL